MFRAALAALGSPEDAEEVAQEAFVAAHRHLDGFRGDASFKTWVISIAWRKALTKRRSVKTLMRRFVAPPEDTEWEFPDRTRTQEQAVIDAELHGPPQAADRGACAQAQGRAAAGRIGRLHDGRDRAAAPHAFRHGEMAHRGGQTQTEEQPRDSGIRMTSPNLDLDHAIDTVAHEMTSADAPAGLRSRVLARIDQERDRPLVLVPRWVWAGALAAAIVAGGTWLRSPYFEPSPATQTEPASQAAQHTAGESLGAAPASSIAGSASSGQIPITAAHRRPSGPPPRTVPADFTDAAPPLGALEPITIASIAPPEVELGDIGVEPMTDPTEIDIPSLDPGSPDKDPIDRNRKER